ncbi:MAG: CoA ester lyase, partial [Chloroflexi bacterium]|nr:CoA ester lyase [Chloroflexota bacterium]
MTFAIKRPRRRTVLFMPGDDLRKIQRGVSLAGVDTIAMDLEDGVALNRKQAARETVCHALDTVDFGRVERLVRLNTPASTLQQDDLAQTVAQHPDGYVLPKVESAETVQAVSGQLGEVERARGWPVGGIRLLALIETARGVLRLDEIAGSDERLDALVFGAEDFAGDIGATRTQAGWEVFHARSAVVIAAAAYGLQAIDTVFTALDDLDGLRADAQRALQMGYDGKLAIHPRQVPVICEVFTPSADEVARAQALMQAFDEHQRQGAGAFELNGRMVDMPMVRAARRVLQRAG